MKQYIDVFRVSSNEKALTECLTQKFDDYTHRTESMLASKKVIVADSFISVHSFPQHFEINKLFAEVLLVQDLELSSS